MCRARCERRSARADLGCHREMESALLEVAERGVGLRVPLARWRQTARCAARRRPARWRRPLVVVDVIDEHRAAGGKHRPEQRIARTSCFGDADEVAPQQLAEQQHVDRALVLKMNTAGGCDHRVIFAAHLHVDAGERRTDLAPTLAARSWLAASCRRRTPAGRAASRDQPRTVERYVALLRARDAVGGKLAIGQRRFTAISAQSGVELIGRGSPTMANSGRLADDLVVVRRDRRGERAASSRACDALPSP